MDINAPIAKLALNNSSDQVAIPEGCNYISIYNPSTDTPAYVKTGVDSAETIDATEGTVIPPNTKETFQRNSKHTYLVGFSADNVTLDIQNGAGV